MFNYVRRERVMETSWQFLMDLRSVSHYPAFGVMGMDHVMEAAKEVLVKLLSNIINDPNNSIEQSRCQIK